MSSRMTHFGENIAFTELDPVNLMLPSDSTKYVSILNYRPLKFQSYEKFTTPKPKEKDLLNFNKCEPFSDSSSGSLPEMSVGQALTALVFPQCVTVRQVTIQNALF